MKQERVILVDEADRHAGTEEKIAAHRNAALHRAFSVFVFNQRGELMLQQRAAAKYHSRRLWSNTCCGHPRPGEGVETAAHRRLREEMGFDCPLTAAIRFAYQAELEDGMFENEIDHVLLGTFNEDPCPNPDEVAAWRWTDMKTLVAEMADAPQRFTAWFGTAIDELARSGFVDLHGSD